MYRHKKIEIIQIIFSRFVVLLFKIACSMIDFTIKLNLYKLTGVKPDSSSQKNVFLQM